MSEACERLPLLGVAVQAYTMKMLNAAIRSAIDADKRLIVANHNLHSIYLCQRDERLRKFFDSAQIVHIDGMPLVWIGRLLGYEFEKRHRTTYVDWMHPLISLAAKESWRVFYVGSKPGVAERGASVLRAQYPSLNIEVAHGYFDIRSESEENRLLLARLKAFRPNLLLVGMGMPRQERWILDNLEELEANAILTSGAAIDYVAGAVPTPPRWAGRIGLEWLCRLLAEPRRLSHRYLIEPWYLVRPFVKDLTRSLRKSSGRPRRARAIPTDA